MKEKKLKSWSYKFTDDEKNKTYYNYNTLFLLYILNRFKIQKKYCTIYITRKMDKKE